MRLIDADALTELIAANVYPVADFFNSRDYGMFWTGGIEKAIDEQPTIDAVEVVRCKDCEFYTEEDRWCRRLGLCGAFNEDDFCSHGERREK